MSNEDNDVLDILLVRKIKNIPGDYKFKKIYNLICDQFVTNFPYGSEAIKNIYQKNIANVMSCITDKKLDKILMFGEVQSGKTNNILFLMSSLLDEGFNKIILLTGTKNNLNKQNISRVREFYFDYTLEEFNKEFLITDNSNEILYGIKQNLNKLDIALDKTNHTLRTKLKIAIIDDECDEATTEKKKNDRALHNTLAKITGNEDFGKCIYIPITATPYSNLIDSSYSDILFPDFVVPLISSKDYCGLQKIENLKLYQKIDNNILEIFKKKNYYNDIVKKFLRENILNFLRQTIIFNENFQFIINISTKVDDNRKIYDIIFDILLNIRTKDFDSLMDEMNIDFNYTEVAVKKINDLTAKLYIQNEEYIREEKPEIIIGGTLLSRGITFDSLLYVLMLNIDSKSTKKIASDNALQKARWLGYRKKYIKFMKIISHETAISFYKRIVTIEEKIRSYYNNKSFKASKNDKERFSELFNNLNLKATI